MELIVAMAIVGFIIVAIITYNLIGEKYYQSASRQVVVTNDAQYIIRKIGDDLKEAKSVEPQEGSEYITITPGVGSQITYRLNGEELLYTDGEVTEEVLANNVEEFEFEVLGKTVKVSIVVAVGETEKTRESSSHEAVFYMRNKE